MFNNLTNENIFSEPAGDSIYGIIVLVAALILCVFIGCIKNKNIQEKMWSTKKHKKL